MDDKPSSHTSISHDDDFGDDHQRLNLALRIIRHRLFAYVVLSLALAASVGLFDHTQRVNLARTEKSARHALQAQVYQNCQQQELIKRQANERIVLLKRAQRVIVFTSPVASEKVRRAVDKVRPLPVVDCTPLRPDKK